MNGAGAVEGLLVDQDIKPAQERRVLGGGPS
jgi:hypothetical protein